MELAIDIVKSILLPKLEKDSNFDNNKADATFWESFATSLLDFEKYDTICKTAIYSLELNKPERMIAKLPNIYNFYIKELAENYVLGNESEAIESLLKSKNQVFIEEVRFLNNLEEVITEIERERIFEILSNANEVPLAELNKKDKKETEVISLSWFNQVVASSRSSRSWIKYAVAACVFFSVGIIYFNTENNVVQPTDNKVVAAPVKKETITPEVPSDALAEVATVTNNATVIESGLGFASKEKKIRITENNQRARMKSIVIAIDRYRQFLEKVLTENKVDYGPVIKEIESKIKVLQNELVLLKERDNHYIFDGKELVIYNLNTSKENNIVLYDKKYYLKRDSDYYLLNITKKNENLIKEINTDVIEILNELTIENQ